MSDALFRARRITGRHLLLDGPGAIIEIPTDALNRTLTRARAGLSALGWEGAPTWRIHQAGASVGVRSWPDQRDTAVALLEWAAGEEGDEELTEIGEMEEPNPRLRALWTAFPGLVFEGEGRLTVGMGVHARSWPLDALPTVAEVGQPRGVPMAMISGTNGKTTTTRLLSFLAASAGRVSGHTSSDAIVIDGETVEQGDWTGPGAARKVLRDPRVQVAVLETARGGILRRGLVMDGADVAVVTNVTSEHLGQWGIDDLHSLARTKLVLALGLKPGGTLVIPAVSEPIYAILPEIRAQRPDIVIRTFASQPHHPMPDGWADATWLHVGGGRVPLAEIPICFGGTARHNVENALAATLAALALGIPAEAISRGLRGFRPSVKDNPGRMNTFRLRSGALVVLDFAHTWDGLLRIAEAVRPWPRARRTLLIGQAGDRSDQELLDFGRAVAALAPHRVVLKEVTKRSYGRSVGEVPALIRRGIIESGVSAAILEGPTPDEPTGIRLALNSAGPDDVIVLLLHETLAAALTVVGDLGGEPVYG